MKKILSKQAIIPFFLLLISLFIFPIAHGAEIANSSSVQKIADASFDTVSGCNDEVLGVTIVQNSIKENQQSPQQSGEVYVFGSFFDNCEFGTSTSFSGTVALNPGEYSQSDLDSATLIKNMNVGGNEIQIALTWTGEGEVASYSTKSKTKDGLLCTKENEKISKRNATVKGSFVVNGLDHISGNTIINGSLGITRNHTKQITK
jgi:hypothetical protein